MSRDEEIIKMIIKCLDIDISNIKELDFDSTYELLYSYYNKSYEEIEEIYKEYYGGDIQ